MSNPQARDSAAPDIEVLLSAVVDDLSLRPGAATRVWRFNGRVIRGPVGTLEPAGDSYLGPTLHVARGQRVRIRFENRLAESSIVHWHGLEMPEEADGDPRLAVAAGSTRISA